MADRQGETDPLTAAKNAKEQKLAEQKGKHRAVPTSTINRGKTQGSGGMSFTTGDDGEDPSLIVSREKQAGGYHSGLAIPKGKIGSAEEDQ